MPTAALPDPWIYRLAIGCIGLALIAFLIAGGVVGASGHAKDMVQEYWAIGSALAGALVGILAPSPRQKKEVAQEEHERSHCRTIKRQGCAPISMRARLASIYQPFLLIVGFGLSLWQATELSQADAAVLRALASGSAGGLLGLLVPSPGTHLRSGSKPEQRSPAADR